MTLMEDIRWVEQQLGDRTTRYIDGRPMTSHEYWEWRGRASGARNHKMVLYRRLKARLKELNVAAYNEARKPDPEKVAAKERRSADLMERLSSIDERLARIEVALAIRGEP
jgi:hypothetical protein